jgi:hypothetical protein
MSIEESVSEILQSLRKVSWAWSKEGVLEGIAPLKPEPISSVSGRLTFQIIDSKTLSVYYHQDKVDFIEITIDAFNDPETLTPSEYEDKVDEFFNKFELAVSTAETVLGKPVFNDGMGSPDFPPEEEAEWLALWPLETVRVMVQQKHEDKELPFRLCLVFVPPADGGTK